MITSIIIGVVAFIIVVYFISTYNRFINLRNGIESTLKQINVALKKRIDMITQIMDSVKGEMKFEKSTLTDITKLRNSATTDMDAKKAKSIDTKTSQILGGLKVQVEAYPDLKSNKNVSQLISSVNTMEEEVARLRYTYNNTIQEFNTKAQTIPSNMVASMFGFNKQKYLEFDENEIKSAPKIKLE